jgi:succinate dehydrogenase hydrophobic anchor subunit
MYKTAKSVFFFFATITNHKTFVVVKDFIMKTLFTLSTLLLLITGCSSTWNGMKTDTDNAADWSKKQVNEGAGYVKEKTE